MNSIRGILMMSGLLMLSVPHNQAFGGFLKKATNVQNIVSGGGLKGNPAQAVELARQVDELSKLSLKDRMGVFQSGIAQDVALSQAFASHQSKSANLRPKDQEKAFHNFLKNNPQAQQQFQMISAEWAQLSPEERQAKIKTASAIASATISRDEQKTVATVAETIKWNKPKPDVKSMTPEERKAYLAELKTARQKRSNQE